MKIIAKTLLATLLCGAFASAKALEAKGTPYPTKLFP